MAEVAAFLSRVIEATGPAGAIIVAVMLALALAFILIARGATIFAAGRREQQATEFQDRLIKAIESLTASEGSLREQVRQLLAENAALREQLGDLTTSVDLLRNQMRRMIAEMRAVKDGRLQPSAIQIPDDHA
ncbi:hypothetical protein [Camelimonas lactis]|uniref:Uncharacterized protein n=1 Tax=Camelimonas lactis TaxID=659006 RepID=A0A4R2GW28_9HYPH|nr:hypothetical protein [Camelimonas lactis]TCO15198.1 hypothetical protein EV666_102176 [Camelimonas lactis]